MPGSPGLYVAEGYNGVFPNALTAKKLGGGHQPKPDSSAPRQVKRKLPKETLQQRIKGASPRTAANLIRLAAQKAKLKKQRRADDADASGSESSAITMARAADGRTTSYTFSQKIRILDRWLQLREAFPKGADSMIVREFNVGYGTVSKWYHKCRAELWHLFTKDMLKLKATCCSALVM